MQRKALQITLIAVSMIPLITGIMGMMGIYDPFYSALGLPHDPVLDSQLRFRNGVWLIYGVSILATVSSFEKHTSLYYTLCAMTFVGGIGRLISIYSIGRLPALFIGFTILETVGAPILLFWYQRIIHQKEISNG